MDNRVTGQELVFSGSGTQNIAVASDAAAYCFQADVTITTDTTFELKIGATRIFSGTLVSNATPIQIFMYDFGKGRGTGIKGDDIYVTLGDAGKVYLTYRILS